MSIEERQKQTTVNVQEKANLIWAIADKLVGVYKPHEYGNFTARDIINLMTERRFVWRARCARTTTSNTATVHHESRA